MPTFNPYLCLGIRWLPWIVLQSGKAELIVGAAYGNGGSNASFAKESRKDLKIDITNLLVRTGDLFLISLVARARPIMSHARLTMLIVLMVVVFSESQGSRLLLEIPKLCALPHIKSKIEVSFKSNHYLVDSNFASTISESGIVHFCWRT